MKKSSEIRRDNLLIAIKRAGSAAKLAAKAGVSAMYLSQIKNRLPESKTGKSKSMGDEVARKIETAINEPEGWMDTPHTDVANVIKTERRAKIAGRRITDVHHIIEEGVVEIPQYDAAGSIGNRLILGGMDGIIKSWRVDYEWLRLNARNHTGVSNLCIVTGFGPSMRPMFNPGDPLLMDRGITTFDREDAVYFFRVGDHGYIKIIQRIPTPNGGVIYRAKSKNQDYEPFDIVEGMDFEVFGKILTIWRSERF